MKTFRIWLMALLIVLIVLFLPIAALAAPARAPAPQDAPVSLSPDVLPLVAGALLSLVFFYIPSLNTYYAQLTDEV